MTDLLDAVRSVPRAASGPSSDASPSHDMLAVRAWARSRGYPIDESAGVPLVVLKTYRRVHGG